MSVFPYSVRRRMHWHLYEDDETAIGARRIAGKTMKEFMNFPLFAFTKSSLNSGHKPLLSAFFLR